MKALSATGNERFSPPFRPAVAQLSPITSSGAALFTSITVPVITPLAVILVFKFIGANFLRAWIAHMETRQIKERR